MASKVNTKFVVIISAVMVVLAGGVGATAVFALKKSPAELAKLGDAKMAERAYADAAEFYSRAVNKEKTNINYLKKWREALELYAPETRIKAEESYGKYEMAIQQTARLLKTDERAHRDYLDLVMERAVLSGGARPHLDALSDAAETAIAIVTNAGGDQKIADRLRRYRGIANFRIMLTDANMKTEAIENARKDLEAALAADPTDEESAEALAGWHEVQSRKIRDTRPDEANIIEAVSEKVLDDFLAREPKNPRVLLGKLRMAASRIDRGVDIKADPDKARTEMERRADLLIPRLDALQQAFESAEQEKLDVDLVPRFSAIERMLDPKAESARSESVMRKIIEKRPTDASVLVIYAGLLADRREYAAGIEILERVIALPPKTVSLTALQLFTLRESAEVQRAIWVVRQWDSEQDAAKKAELLARAKQYRDALGKTLQADSERLMFIKAQIAFAEGDMNGADKLFSQYNEKVKGADPEGLWLGAQTAMRLPRPNPGVARDLLRKLQSLQPGNMQAILLLAEVEASLSNNEESLRLMEYVQKFDKTNERLNDRIELLRNILSGRAETRDPVVNVLIQAQEMLKQPNNQDAALKFLEDALPSNNWDPRLVQAIVQQKLAADDRPGALEVTRRGAEVHPQSLELRRLSAALSAPDPMHGEIEVINVTPGEEITKAIQRYVVYKRYGKKDEAAAALDQAVKLAPQEVSVIEFQFLEALEAKDYAKAATLVEAAKNVDADRAGGGTFRARLQSAQGQNREAIATMEQVIASSAPNPEFQRLLARVQAQAGRMSEAIASLEKALRVRPGDVATINELVSGLISQERHSEALRVARESERFAGNDRQFLAMWLFLEGSVGNKELALQKRLTLSRIMPNDRENFRAIAYLQIDLKKWADARKTIDQLRAASYSIDIPQLEAKWHDEQGNIPAAKAAYEEFFANAEPSKINSHAYLAKASFLGIINDMPGMLEAIEKARTIQDPVRMEGDRALADAYFRLGMDEKAIEVVRRLIAGGADTAGRDYQKRIAETYIRLGKLQEAEKELAPLIDPKNPDPILMLLQADIKAAAKDSRGARAVLDDAVRRFPDNPTVYLKRAQITGVDQALRRDAFEDVERALRLSPSSWQALRLRAALNVSEGRQDQAIKDLRAALKLNPSLDDLRDGLLNDLLSLKRTSEAVEVADEAIEARANDINVIMAVANLFARAEEWERATQFYKRAFEKNETNLTALRYADACLKQKTPNTAEAESVLRKVQDKVVSDWALTMVRARAFFFRGEAAKAKQSSKDALKLLNTDDPQQMLFWYGDLQRIIGDAKDMIPFLEQCERENIASDWMKFFRGNVLFNLPGQLDLSIDLLRNLATNAKLPALRQLSHRMIGTAYYAKKMYQQAADGWARGIEAFPDDHEMLNNIAFLYAKHLDRAPEAITHAEKSVRIAPNIPEALDTLGLAYLRAGKLTEARDTLKKALELTMRPRSLVSTLHHLAEVNLKLGDKTAAAENLKTAKEVMNQHDSEMDDDTRAEHDEVTKLLV